MPTLEDLPNELQLLIIERPTFTAMDLIRFSATSSRWRTLIHTCRALQERLFLRPLDNPPLEDLTLDIRVIVRPIPITIRNDFSDRIHEMTLEIHSNYDSHLNPVVLDLGHWAHLISPHFKGPQETVDTRRTSHPLPRALRFHDFAELSRLLSSRTDPDASWRDMLVTRHPVRRMHVHWTSDLRRQAGNNDFVTHLHIVSTEGENMRMDRFVEIGRRSLKLMAKSFREDKKDSVVRAGNARGTGYLNGI